MVVYVFLSVGSCKKPVISISTLPALQSSVHPHMKLASQSSIHYTADCPWGASLLSTAQGGSAEKSKMQKVWTAEQGLGWNWRKNSQGFPKKLIRGNVLNKTWVNSNHRWCFSLATTGAEMLQIQCTVFHQKQSVKSNKLRNAGAGTLTAVSK